MLFLILAGIQGISFFFFKLANIETFFFVWCFIPFVVMYFASSSSGASGMSMHSVNQNFDFAVSADQQKKKRTAMNAKISLDSEKVQLLALALINIVITVFI